MSNCRTQCGWSVDECLCVVYTDPLLRCEVDSITHEIILSFLGRVQLEVVSALLSEKYKLETVVKEPSVIYMERPLKAASHTIHIEVPPDTASNNSSEGTTFP